MRFFYDLHIHSALSPCGDTDMTPNNIVNMALLKGLDIIAVSDHNSCGNVRSVQKAAGDRLLVIPAMELETSEEVHLLCLFPDLESASKMEDAIRSKTPFIKNRPEIFGNQYYFDENDNILGEEESLLVRATGIDIYSAVKMAGELGGVAVPAHIDRSSYSILSNLGFIPPDLKIGAVEITSDGREAMAEEYKSLAVLTNSDAHYLWDISERDYFIELPEKSISCVLSHLSCKNL